MSKSKVNPLVGNRNNQNFSGKKEKLKNPKKTINRLLKYLDNKKIVLVLVSIFCIITTLVSILGIKLNGDIMSSLTNDVDNINTTLSQSISQFFSGIINIFGILIAMFMLSPSLTLVDLITTPIMFLTTRLIMKNT